MGMGCKVRICWLVSPIFFALFLVHVEARHRETVTLVLGELSDLNDRPNLVPDTRILQLRTSSTDIDPVRGHFPIQHHGPDILDPGVR